MSFVLLLLAVPDALIARAAVRRPAGHRPIWVIAMAGSELAPWLLGGTALVAGGFVAAGWAGGPAGVVGLGILSLAGLGYLVAIVRAFGARSVTERSVEAFLGEPVVLGRVPLRRLVPPRPGERGLEVVRDLHYGPHARHLVDRIALPEGGRRPAIVHVHGGGWLRGRQHLQGLPLLHRMAREGWVAFTATYRLSPEATFPDHLVDVKRLLVWIRENADELGVDGSFIAVAGGSAGGQLAALAGLTVGDPSLQPGFESGDASVQLCVPFYGVHDLLDDDGVPLWPYLVDSVMRTRPDVDPESWRRASPTRMATAGRPPFFVVHGATDTLIGPRSSRDLVAALRAVGGPPVGHLEVPWGNHGFDYFQSIRCGHVVDGVVAVLTRVRERRSIEGQA